jgi:hypothetical protein
VVGIILLGFGLSASLLIFIAERIINPDGVKPDKDGYFSEDISKNVKYSNISFNS